MDIFDIQDHMKIGALTGAICIGVNSLQSGWGIFLYLVQIIAAGLAAVIPDLDHPHGKINQVILGINKKYFLMLVYSLIGLVFVFYGGGFNGYFIGLFIILMGCTRHRGFTHSLIAMVWFYLLLRSTLIEPVTLETLLKSAIGVFGVFKHPVTWQQYVLRGAFIGYLSHLGSDYLTNHGTELLWPNKTNYRFEIFSKSNIGTLYTIMISTWIINVIVQVM